MGSYEILSDETPSQKKTRNTSKYLPESFYIETDGIRFYVYQEKGQYYYEPMNRKVQDVTTSQTKTVLAQLRALERQLRMNYQHKNVNPVNITNNLKESKSQEEIEKVVTEVATSAPNLVKSVTANDLASQVGINQMPKEQEQEKNVLVKALETVKTATRMNTNCIVVCSQKEIDCKTTAPDEFTLSSNPSSHHNEEMEIAVKEGQESSINSATRFSSDIKSTNELLIESIHPQFDYGAYKYQPQTSHQDKSNETTIPPITIDDVSHPISIPISLPSSLNSTPKPSPKQHLTSESKQPSHRENINTINIEAKSMEMQKEPIEATIAGENICYYKVRKKDLSIEHVVKSHFLDNDGIKGRHIMMKNDINHQIPAIKDSITSHMNLPTLPIPSPSFQLQHPQKSKNVFVEQGATLQTARKPVKPGRDVSYEGLFKLGHYYYQIMSVSLLKDLLNGLKPIEKHIFMTERECLVHVRGLILCRYSSIWATDHARLLYLGLAMLQFGLSNLERMRLLKLLWVKHYRKGGTIRIYLEWYCNG